MKKEKVTDKKFCQDMECGSLRGNQCEAPGRCPHNLKEFAAWKAGERKSK